MFSLLISSWKKHERSVLVLFLIENLLQVQREESQGSARGKEGTRTKYQPCQAPVSSQRRPIAHSSYQGQDHPETGTGSTNGRMSVKIFFLVLSFRYSLSI